MLHTDSIVNFNHFMSILSWSLRRSKRGAPGEFAQLPADYPEAPGHQGDARLYDRGGQGEKEVSEALPQDTGDGWHLQPLMSDGEWSFSTSLQCFQKRLEFPRP